MGQTKTDPPVKEPEHLDPEDSTRQRAWDVAIGKLDDPFQSYGWQKREQ